MNIYAVYRVVWCRGKWGLSGVTLALAAVTSSLSLLRTGM